MWPFGKRLKDQDAVEKFRRWLRRWLLGARWRCFAAAAAAAALLAGIIWATVSTWNNTSPAAGDKPPREVITGFSPVTEKSPAGRLEDKFVRQQAQEINEKEPAGAGAGGGGEPEAAVSRDEPGAMVLPVSGRKISSYGFHYSPVYGDYRFHTGIVLQAEENNEVRSCLPGKVTEISFIREKGYSVKVDHGDGWASIYEDLDRVVVAKNDGVDAGGLLGRAKIAGASGKGEITFTLLRNGEPVDPTPYIQKY